MQYEAHIFRVDFDTETITHRAGFKTGKDGKPEKWAWYEVTKDDLESAQQAIQRCNVNWDIFKSNSIDELRQYFNPYSGIVSLFLKWLLEYPRIQCYVRGTPSDRVEIGGVEYINTDTPPPDFEESIKGRIDEYDYSTGGFDNKRKAFKEYVDWVGVNFNCNPAAQKVIMAFDSLDEALHECGIDGFADLGEAIGHATKALADMTVALAEAAQSGGGKTKTNPKNDNENRRRYPKDNEAKEVLKEAARRKRCKSYSGDSNADIIKHMIEEPQSKWTARILHGKIKGKANGQGREKTKPLDKDKAAKTWSKHLSAYLKDHPPKQGA